MNEMKNGREKAYVNPNSIFKDYIFTTCTFEQMKRATDEDRRIKMKELSTQRNLSPGSGDLLISVHRLMVVIHSV